MAERISQKRKTSLTLQAECMRAAKQLKHIESTSSPELFLSGLSSMNDSFQVPGPSAGDYLSDFSDESDGIEEDYNQ